MTIPANLVERLEGNRADVAIVKDNMGLCYQVAYEYSKAKDLWRFHLRGHSRYVTSNLASARGVAKRLLSSLNGV